jgi:transcriptional regulator with GAF, ATPase, and Fis domain/serine/threonine protein kinase
MARRKSPPSLSGDEWVLLRAARGGTVGEVWQARDAQGQTLALKLAHDPAGARRLADEARYASFALSPRLPELIDLGFAATSDGKATRCPPNNAGARAFLALRWHAGEALKTPQRVKDRVTRALAVAIDVGTALADLHAAGLSHGDVKPANIVVDDDGRASLIDLGMCAPLDRRRPSGGTPRYLARGDAQLGDGRARDVLALGLVLAELVSKAVARADDPLTAARAADLPAPLAALCLPLLTPEPGARPSADWLSEMARSLASAPPPADRAERDQRRVRASYLRLRMHELRGAVASRGEVCDWLREALELEQRARAMRGTAVDPATGERRAAGEAAAETTAERNSADEPTDSDEHADSIGPMGNLQRQRWFAALVGRAALSWPAHVSRAASEPQLARALSELAGACSPQAWTLSAVEHALRGEPTAVATKHGWSDLERIDASTAAGLGLAIRRMPPNADAIATIERLREHAPAPLRLAAADALRLSGELGRARALLELDAEADAIAPDVLRRGGALGAAEALARKLLQRNADRDGRARATLARIVLDRGELEEATSLLEHAGGAAELEVLALLAHRRGDVDEAKRHAERGLALADDAEARARLWATAAFVTRGRDPEAARSGYRRAVEHAARAGALLEEASYRTGEAAACADLGQLDAAIDTAQRAASLFSDVLQRPALAARAWLTIAAAHASVGAREGAEHAARHAIRLAEASDDARAQAYAWLCIADACPPGSRAGDRAARRADELAGAGFADDALLCGARLLLHAPEALSAERRSDLDRAAETHERSAFARFDWWGARARVLCQQGARADSSSRRVVTQLVTLAEARAPAAAAARALHHGQALAAAVADTEAAARLGERHRQVAAVLREGTRGALAERAASCAWLRSERPNDDQAPQAIDLQGLVRALSERTSLRALLSRVIDVLLLWTGAERGLLLLRTPEGRLQPRAARNVGRRDLSGEQLALSTSLAQRALDEGEPVVAVDAMSELGDHHQSVHALKLRSVLALPLEARGELLGVVYLDDRVRRGAFGPRELAWATAVAPIAALAIADARDQVALRRAVRRAERATRKLEQNLADKETALEVAEQELARTGARGTRHAYDDIIGEAPALKRVLALVDRVAAAEVPVLLTGESGSGKELVARAIHRYSARAEHPFVGENCGALPETLLESTLFGHVRGAFTGAHRPRTGLLEAASGGTLFLDEVGEMSLGMQTKLLRVLEEQQVRPVGSEHERTIDVRVIAATHRDLEAMVADGRFREDLFYRLNVIALRIPPLRERPTDVPLLVRHFLRKHHPDATEVPLSDAAMQRLQAFAWPGNVRQLENEVRRALLLCDGRIEVEHLTLPEADASQDLGLDVRARVDRLEVELVNEALQCTRGNQTKAAKLLGVSRYGLHKMMKRLGIDAKKAAARAR